VLAVKIYRSRLNQQFCKEHGIHLSGPKLGRPFTEGAEQKKQNYIDECNRIEVKRKFSLAKRKYGLGLIMTKLKETIGHSIAMSIVVLNLRKLRAFYIDSFILSGVKFVSLGFVTGGIRYKYNT
jgi:IS5 family transposase